MAEKARRGLKRAMKRASERVKTSLRKRGSAEWRQQETRGGEDGGGR